MLLGVIPARGGSKGIPKKNLHPLNGKPLIDYTIEAAKASKLDDFVVSTEDEEIKEHCSQFCKVIVRPDELAQDATPTLPAIQHAVAEYEKHIKVYGVTVDGVMTLQPTSPLRTTKDINRVIDLFLESNTDSLYSGYYIGIKHKNRPYDKRKEEPHFQRNGAIFITKRELIDQGKLWSDNVLEFEMPKTQSIDIDDYEDLLITEAILSKGEIQ